MITGSRSRRQEHEQRTLLLLLMNNFNYSAGNNPPYDNSPSTIRAALV